MAKATVRDQGCWFSDGIRQEWVIWDWHGVSDRFLNLSHDLQEMSISPFWDTADAGCSALPLSQNGHHVGRTLPPKRRLTLAASSLPVHSTSISWLFNRPATQLWPRCHSQQAAQGLHCRVQAPPLPYFRAPTPSPSSLHTCPTGFSWFLWGFPLWGLCSSCPFCPAPPPPPPNRSQHFWGHMQAFFTRALRDTTCSSWIPITATTHSGLSSDRSTSHLKLQLYVPLS